jgi:hypothetical protein
VVTITWAARTSDRRGLLREAAIAAGLGVALVLVFDGAPFNPTGFAARVRFLLGPASQDFAQYSKDFAGRAAAFADSWSPFSRHYPWAIAALIVVGAFVSATRREPRARALAPLPLLAALSFTLTFNCWARRGEERFVMPQMLFVGVYAAVALAYLLERVKTQPVKIALGLAVASTFAVGIHKSASVSAVMLRDPRYDAEAFLKEHARPGDVVEVYGRNVYLPRFPSWLKVVRVGTEPLERRNPMPGIEEKQDAYGNIEARSPRFIVFGGGFAWRYLINEWAPVDGRVQPTIHRAGLADQDGRDYFRRLFEERAGYAKALHARYESRLFPLVQMHGSLGAEVFVFQRR